MTLTYPPVTLRSGAVIAHEITGNDLDVSCVCGWYNHDPDKSADRSPVAHILRELLHDPHRADEAEAAYREWMS